MGVLVDITKCIGCRRCEAACHEANGFEVLTEEALEDKSVFAEHRRPGPRDYTTINAFPRRGTDTEPGPVYVKSNCLHCIDPACVSACLVGAFSKEPDGVVAYDAWKCMGCRYCMVACPFQIPAYEYDNALTPQVRKCTLCANEGNPNKGGVPACVGTCPKEVMTYGKRRELLARAHALIERYPNIYADHVYGEHEVGGTSWLYLGPQGYSFQELGFLELGSAPPPMRTERIQHGIFKYFIPPLAWYGLLGAVMWVTRSDAAPQQHAPTERTH
jgi:Fe-S-cluster-containing dehydrogenase component